MRPSATLDRRSSQLHSPGETTRLEYAACGLPKVVRRAWPVAGTPARAAVSRSYTKPPTTPASTSGRRRVGTPSSSTAREPEAPGTQGSSVTVSVGSKAPLPDATAERGDALQDGLAEAGLAEREEERTRAGGGEQHRQFSPRRRGRPLGPCHPPPDRLGQRRDPRLAGEVRGGAEVADHQDVVAGDAGDFGGERDRRHVVAGLDAPGVRHPHGADAPFHRGVHLPAVVRQALDQRLPQRGEVRHRGGRRRGGMGTDRLERRGRRQDEVHLIADGGRGKRRLDQRLRVVGRRAGKAEPAVGPDPDS